MAAVDSRYIRLILHYVLVRIRGAYARARARARVCVCVCVCVCVGSECGRNTLLDLGGEDPLLGEGTETKGFEHYWVNGSRNRSMSQGKRIRRVAEGVSPGLR